MAGVVIIGDSDPLSLQRRASALESAGRRVLSRPLNKSLIDALQNQSLDAVVLGFPGEVDYGFCRAVRSHAPAPLIVVSGGPTFETIESALGAGVDDFLIQPSNGELNRRVLMWRRPELRANLDQRREKAKRRVVEALNGGGAAVSDIADLLAQELELTTPALDAIAPPDGLSGDFFGALVADAPEPAPASRPPAKATPKSDAPQPAGRKGKDTERLWR